MIGGVIADLSSRVPAADGVFRTDDTIAVGVDGAGDVSIVADQSAWLDLRVQSEGKIGTAHGPAGARDAVVERAIHSATVGDPWDIILPASSPVAGVPTRATEAADATAADLLAVARGLRDRLRRDDWALDVWAQRSAGTVEVANTRGVAVGYDASLAGLGASITDRRAGLSCKVHVSQAELPGSAEIEALAGEATSLLAIRPVASPPLTTTTRVWFRPRAVRALLRPIIARHLRAGSINPRAGPRLSSELTLVDDPLQPLRPGSRPIDDDGVPTRRLTLIDRGDPVAGGLDLVAAALTGLPPTGHSWRRSEQGARVGFSNLMLLAGQDESEALFRAVGDGLIVAALEWGPAPNPRSGVFRVAAPWTYLARGGEVAGRVEGVVLTGSVFELLQRTVAVGADRTWIGAASVPSLVIDGVGRLA